MRGIREMAIDSEKPETERPTYHKTYNSDGNEVGQGTFKFPSYGEGHHYSPHHKDAYGGAFDYDEYDPYSSFNKKKPKKKQENTITVELTVTYEEIGTTEELSMVDSGKEYDQLQEKAEDKAIEKLDLFAGKDITERYTVSCNANDNFLTGFDVTLTCTPIE
jgi:hypothetical protein